MKFKNIQEFIDLAPECQHCGNSLQTFVKSKTNPRTGVRYNMTFDTTQFTDPFQQEIDNAFNGQDQITYPSVEGPTHMIFCYQLKGISHPIFSLDKKTNAISGELDRIQRVIWDHKPVIRRQCVNEVCIKKQRNYIYESSPLTLERISKTVYPFFLDTEILTIDHNNDIYGLMTVREMRATFLMAARNMIKELPATPLYRIKGSEAIYNKIQTLVNFS